MRCSYGLVADVAKPKPSITVRVFHVMTLSEQASLWAMSHHACFQPKVKLTSVVESIAQQTDKGKTHLSSMVTELYVAWERLVKVTSFIIMKRDGARPPL
jgi:hypothetical protein